MITVLWVVMLLSLVMTVVAQTSRLDGRVSFAGAERVRCKWALRAGVETAVAVLNDDPKSSDSFDDMWHENVEDDQIGISFCHFLQGFLAVGGFFDLESQLAQHHVEELEVYRLVVNNKNFAL